MRFLRLYVPEFYRSVRFAVTCLADRLRTVLRRIDTGGEKIARRMTAIAAAHAAWSRCGHSNSTSAMKAVRATLADEVEVWLW